VLFIFAANEEIISDYLAAFGSFNATRTDTVERNAGVVHPFGSNLVWSCHMFETSSPWVPGSNPTLSTSWIFFTAVPSYKSFGCANWFASLQLDFLKHVMFHL